MNETLVVNLFAGPGAGKSKFCASIFAELKWENIESEQALEFAKDKVWEENAWVLENQFYVFGNQSHRIYRLHNKVDVIVTDSPLLFSMIYDAKKNENFKQLILNEHNKHNNINFFIERTGGKESYNPKGRVQTYEEALEIDNQIKDMLSSNSVDYESVPGERKNIQVILGKILDKINSK